MTFYLCGPDGKRLGVYQESSPNGNWNWANVSYPAPQTFQYLGGKALNYSEDRLSSNGNRYYPYGQAYSGTSQGETPTFGTYVPDQGSGMLYADQRYYNAAWGRFLTPDPSNKNINLLNSMSWNRFSYASGDVMNLTDPSGLTVCDENGDNCYDSIDVNGDEPAFDPFASAWISNLTSLTRTLTPQQKLIQRQTESLSELQQHVESGDYGCPTMPGHPENADLLSNIHAAQAERQVAETAGASTSGVYAIVAELQWLYDHVHNHAVWDYKQQGRQYGDFGNFNFGAVGLALGLNEDELRRAAGWAQTRAGTSQPDWSNPFAKSPYGDDPLDQAQIIMGFGFYTQLQAGNCPPYKP